MIYLGVSLLGLLLMFCLVCLGFWAEREFSPSTSTGISLHFMFFIFWFFGLLASLFVIGGGLIGFVAPLFGIDV